MTQKVLEKPIRLLVFDIDGCLSRGSFSHFSLPMIERLREVNRMAVEDPSVPLITVCTGRPQPYVECFLQMTVGTMPALCEGGTVLFDPRCHGVYLHRDFGIREERLLEKLRHDVESELVNDFVMFEPGKVTHLTLLVIEPYSPEQLLPAALEIAGRYGGEFIVETTRICVHFLFKHLHKGTGVAWLSERTGIGPEQMAGMGDALADISFLQMVGLAGAPANAHAEVKALAHFVSEKSDAEGALEFIDWVIAQNRGLIAATSS